MTKTIMRVTHLKSSKISFIFFSLFVIILSSCTPQNQQVVCNKPYILVGNSCCLDSNNNNICDNDEIKEDKKEVSETKKPVMDEEKKEVTATAKKQTYSIDNIQADVSNAIEKNILLEKVKESAKFDLYLTRSNTATLIAESSGFKVSKVLDKFEVAVIDIKNEDLNSKEDFLNYIKSQIPILTSYIDNRENEVVTEAKKGELYDLFKKGNLLINFVDYSVSEDVLYDSIIPLDTVSDKIVEILKVSIQNYDLTYNGTSSNPKELVTKNVLGLKYVQAYSIFCGESLVIVLYGKGYNNKINNLDIANYVNNLKSEMIVTSQKVVSKCGERYSLS